MTISWRPGAFERPEGLHCRVYTERCSLQHRDVLLFGVLYCDVDIQEGWYKRILGSSGLQDLVTKKYYLEEEELFLFFIPKLFERPL